MAEKEWECRLMALAPHVPQLSVTTAIMGPGQPACSRDSAQRKSNHLGIQHTTEQKSAKLKHHPPVPRMPQVRFLCNSHNQRLWLKENCSRQGQQHGMANGPPAGNQLETRRRRLARSHQASAGRHEGDVSRVERMLANPGLWYAYEQGDRTHPEVRGVGCHPA